jgi:putative membrane protein
VPRTFLLALRGDYDRHRLWARWTFPIWYYVSVSGVLVYFFLYRWWPAAGGGG